MNIKPFRISRCEYEKLRELQLKTRKGWWAVFSVNNRQQVWPFVCRGLTPVEDRHYVALEEHQLLHDIAGYLVENVHEMGGRFFISKDGVYCFKGEAEPAGSKPEHFVVWKPDEALPDTPVEPAPDSNRSESRPTPIPVTLTFGQLREMQQRYKRRPDA